MSRARINRPNALPAWAVKALEDRGAPAHPMWLYAEIGEPDSCWEWFGAHKVDGYGRTYHDGKFVMAHRLIYCIANGLDLGEFTRTGLLVRHTCDNPPCCNPRHLVPGSAQQNVDDKIRRGRTNAPRGRSVHNALLTEQDVHEIRRRLRAGELRRTLADAFNVALSTIDQIKARRNWGWLPEES